MLEILNDLGLFFEDCVRRYSVREYAKLMNVSPPTASKILKELASEELLKSREDRRYLFFWANRENRNFIELSRMYWRQKLEQSGFIEYLKKSLVNPTVILFGSLSKAENTADSDIDIAIFAGKRELDFRQFEKKLKREIQPLFFGSFKTKNKELLTNIANGYVIMGWWKQEWIG